MIQDIALKNKIANAFVTKIGINYDMVHEYFRLGDSDRPSFDFVTFQRLIYLKPRLGKVEIKISERVQLEEADMSTQIVSVLMTSSIVSTLLLMSRRGVAQELLLQRFKQIFDDLRAKKLVISLTTTPTTDIQT